MLTFWMTFLRFGVGLLLVSALWAGRYFPLGEGETSVPDEVLVRLKPGAQMASVLSSLPAGAKAQVTQNLNKLNIHLISLPAGTPVSTLEQFAAHPLVVFVEPNGILQSQIQSPNDPSYSELWALETVQALDGWRVLPNRYLTSSTTGTSRIKVAVLDTGADCTHPDFINSGGTSTDSADGGQLSFKKSKAIIRTKAKGKGCKWADDQGHGTHVAGTVAAATNNAEGVSSLGYPLELIIFKVLNQDGSGTEASVANGIIGATDAGAHIISLSLGALGYSQTMQDAVTYAWERNSLLVAAAGNNSTNALFFPAGANHAIGVSSTGANDNLSWFSNFGDYVDIAAPGENILSTAPTYPVTSGALNYGYSSGTSMATPHVSALAGLVASTTPNLSSAAIAMRVQRSATSATAEGGWNLNIGYGTIDARHALAGTLPISSTGSIVGQVVDASGLPIDSAQVSVAAQSVTTDSTGLFRLANLVPATHLVTTSATGFPMRNDDVTVVGGADAALTVSMGTDSGKLTGTVTSGGLPLAGAVVEAVQAGLIRAEAFTNDSGMYTLSVLPGTYNVRSSSLSKVTTTVSAGDLAAGETLSVATILLPNMGTVAGVVLDPNLNPIPNAQISVVADSFSTSAFTAFDGTYTTMGLPDGTYTVTASASGFNDVTQTGAVVSTDVVATADFQMTYLPTGFPPLRVNAGGAAYIDPAGQTWSADSGFVGGGVFSTSSSISGTNTPDLYQSEHWASGSFEYVIALPYGNYMVNLKFAEIWFSNEGQRTFNVAINGQTVLSNFDVVAEAGGPFIAVDRAFPVNVTTGQIVVEFTALVSNPKVNAIEITPVTISPAAVTLMSSETQQFTATVSGAANTDVTWSIGPAVGTISLNGLYTAPPTIAVDQTVSVIATSVANPTTSATAVVTLLSNAPIRVNAGGGEYIEPASQVWSADTGFISGSTFSTNSSIGGTNTPELYQTERYEPGTLRYQFVRANGNYKVKLKFAELWFTQAGERVFDVAINGVPVLTNFDVVAEAGGAFIAVDRQFPVSVSGHEIVIEFFGIVSNPKINAIEILPDSGIAVEVSPTSVALADGQSQQFTATVSGTPNGAVTWSIDPAVGTISSGGLYTAPANVGVTQTVNVTASSVEDTLALGGAVITLLPNDPIRVNTGGGDYTDPAGQLWSTDTGFDGGGTFSTGASIAGTNTPELYQTEHFASGTLRYQFARANGNYRVKLKFAEIWFTQAGERVFDVAINGQPVLSNFDIVAEAGGAFAAVDRQFPLIVSNDEIIIEFSGIVSNPKISAIEILPDSGIVVVVDPPSVTLTDGQSQQFTATVSGTPDGAVTWSITPAVGTILDGLYTAPASVGVSETVTVTAASVADPNQSGSGVVTLVPNDPIRVNSGGGQYTDPASQVWSADTGFEGGGTFSTGTSIGGTDTPELYQTERWASGSLVYRFARPNADYQVTLKFAEIWFTSAGQRVFNAAINGQPVLANFDIVAEAGAAFTAVDRQFPVSVSGEEIVIEFTGVVSNPKISAIEILPG
ncbi:MAG: malectin domain-containing carbohydrate-binding protein, partial [Planctomycetota bacterium]|nr:malectin domain-containing carbohydrate-binding protein [Planctomycetota bacterium]